MCISITLIQYHPGYHCLLKGENPLAISTLHSNDVIISEEVCAQPSPPPPASHLITAQVEATTLTQAQYNAIATVMCSLLHLPTGALVYDGHTYHPLTLHWHCAAEELQDDDLCHSFGTLVMMSRVGIDNITFNGKELYMPQKEVSM